MPVVGGDTLLVVGGFLAVVILWLVIRGALSVTRNDTSDEDPAGVGILDGIDEDDDKPAKKKK